MNIMMGNLSVEEIEKRTGVSIPDDVKSFMNEARQHEAKNIAKGKWHCFDMPFNLVCGDMETAQRIYKSILPFAKEFKEPLQISLQN